MRASECAAAGVVTVMESMGQASGEVKDPFRSRHSWEAEDAGYPVVDDGV